jgi:hypothetical protein
MEREKQIDGDRPVVHVDDHGLPIYWDIRLNVEQRDNLLWLLCDVIGCVRSYGIDPFKLANTGDWVMEIALMLASTPGGQLGRQFTHDRPVVSAEEFQQTLNAWVARVVSAAHVDIDVP